MKYIYINTIFILLFFSVSAQNELTMLVAIEKALENNYDIQIQQMEEQITQLNNNWGTAGRFPSLSASVNSNNKTDFDDANSLSQFQLIGGVNLNWILFDGFRVNISKQRLEEFEKLSKGNTAVLVEGTIQSVILAYNNVLLEQEKLKVYQTNEHLSNDRFEYEKMRKEIGNAVSYEVLQAQNSYLADRSDVLLQEANVKAARRNLAYLMGEEYLNYQFIEELKSGDFVIEREQLKEAMLKSNKNLINQYINQSITNKAGDLAKAAYFPKLSLNTGLQNSRVLFDEVPTNPSSIYANFTLSYNLFSGGVRKRAVQISKIEEDIAELEITNLRVSLINQLNNLCDYYLARESILELADERLKVAQINLNISEEKLKAGTINSFNYRDVQLSYQNAAISRLNAVYNLIDVNLAILRITGGIINED